MGFRTDLGSLLRDRAREFSSERFLRLVAEDDRWLTYGEFNHEVNRVAHGLRSLGVRIGDYVALMLPNGLPFLLTSYALKKLGAVEVAINSEFRGPTLARTINLTGASILVTDTSFLAPLELVGRDLEHVRTLVTTGGAAPLPPSMSSVVRVEFDELLGNEAAELHTPLVDTDVQAVLFTSGTTGISKGCMLSHRYAIRTAEGMVEALELTPNDCVYTPFPLHHAGAAYYDVLSMVLVGGRVALDVRFSPSRFWDCTRDVGATWFEILGSVQKLLWDQDPAANDADNPVRIACGGPLPVPAKPFEERFGLRLLPGGGYSSTDAGFVTSVTGDSGPAPVRAMYEVQVVDEQDDPLHVGEIGEIVVRPREPDVMSKGYFGMPEQTAAAWRNLWFHSGDLGYLDPAGKLMFLGRKSDRIRRRGENVSAVEVEEVIMSHPAVSECAVIGVKSEFGEDDVKAFVTERSGQRVDIAELRAFCRERLARFMVPDHFEILDEMPRTATGKPAKSELAQRERG